MCVKERIHSSQISSNNSACSSVYKLGKCNVNVFCSVVHWCGTAVFRPVNKLFVIDRPVWSPRLT